MSDLSELHYIWNTGFEVCSLTVQGMLNDYIYSSENLLFQLLLPHLIRNSSHKIFSASKGCFGNHINISTYRRIIKIFHKPCHSHFTFCFLLAKIF